jgi:hypothetical protein
VPRTETTCLPVFLFHIPHGKIPADETGTAAHYGIDLYVAHRLHSPLPAAVL